MNSRIDDPVEPVSTGSMVILRADEIDDLKKRFFNGDAAAAYRLYKYFAFSKNDAVEADAWLVRAAEAGDKDAIYAWAVALTVRENYKLAQVWAKKSQSLGHKRASGLLVEIEEALAAGK